jgi:hypothetical protein
LSDNAQGYGRVDLDAVVAPTGSQQVYFIDDSTGLHTGYTHEYTIRVTSSGSPLKVVMAYSDYPGESLVNNLNLMLIDPDDKYYAGNGSGGGSLTMDATNNVEMVQVKSPKRGDWKIRVVGASVPHGPQQYALAVKGRLTA